MKRLGSFAAALAGIVVLSGCSVVNQAGAAAVVGDERLTVAEVGVQYAEVQTALNDQPIEGTSADINRQLITSFIMSNVIDLALAEAGVEVTAGEIAAQRQQLLAQVGSKEALAVVAAQAAIPPSQIDRALKISLAYAALVNHFKDPKATDPVAAEQDAERATIELVNRIAAQQGVSVSPRYGRWDSENLLIMGDSGSDVLITAEMLAQMAAGQQ